MPLARAVRPAVSSSAFFTALAARLAADAHLTRTHGTQAHPPLPVRNVVGVCDVSYGEEWAAMGFDSVERFPTKHTPHSPITRWLNPLYFMPCHSGSSDAVRG
jgi:hypothetical protein